jgi:hypothetical protein
MSLCEAKIGPEERLSTAFISLFCRNGTGRDKNQLIFSQLSKKNVRNEPFLNYIIGQAGFMNNDIGQNGCVKMAESKENLQIYAKYMRKRAKMTGETT